jgi:succinate dehydrogenase/fumarate reductase flavoprotein subunit
VHPTASHSAAATGGINAAVDPDDSPSQHAEDTLRAADGLADRAAVDLVCEGAGDAIHRLERLGVPFNRDASGRLGAKSLGGSSHARTISVTDHTGRAMLSALWERARAIGVRIEHPVFLLDLVVDDRCHGAVGLRVDTGEVIACAGPVVLATGGLGAVYETTTNAAINTGDGIAAVWRAGGWLRDMEFTQFYPTAFVGSGICVTEEARTLGAVLVNEAGERFMTRSDPTAMELATRDVVSRAVAEEVGAGRGAYLDCRTLPQDALDHDLASFRRLARRLAGVDVARGLLPVTTAQHYHMGGIATDTAGRTSIDGLFAAGECACVSVHGANRIGANSLLETVVIGDLCGRTATAHGLAPSERACEVAAGDASTRVARRVAQVRGSSLGDLRSRVGRVMDQHVGVVRSAGQLARAAKELEDLADEVGAATTGANSDGWTFALLRLLELENLTALGATITASAEERRESRGAHFRSDFPQHDATPVHSEISWDGARLLTQERTVGA